MFVFYAFINDSLGNQHQVKNVVNVGGQGKVWRSGRKEIESLDVNPMQGIYVTQFRNRGVLKKFLVK